MYRRPSSRHCPWSLCIGVYVGSPPFCQQDSIGSIYYIYPIWLTAVFLWTSPEVCLQHCTPDCIPGSTPVLYMFPSLRLFCSFRTTLCCTISRHCPFTTNQSQSLALPLHARLGVRTRQSVQRDYRPTSTLHKLGSVRQCLWWRARLQ